MSANAFARAEQINNQLREEYAEGVYDFAPNYDIIGAYPGLKFSTPIGYAQMGMASRTTGYVQTPPEISRLPFSGARSAPHLMIEAVEGPNDTRDITKPTGPNYLYFALIGAVIYFIATRQ